MKAQATVLCWLTPKHNIAWWMCRAPLADDGPLLHAVACLAVFCDCGDGHQGRLLARRHCEIWTIAPNLSNRKRKICHAAAHALQIQGLGPEGGHIVGELLPNENNTLLLLGLKECDECGVRCPRTTPTEYQRDVYQRISL